MTIKSFNMKLLIILILSSLLILASCKQVDSNKNNSLSNSDTAISTANLSSNEKNLIKIGGIDNYYVFEVINPKDANKNITCWVDLFEGGKLKTSFGKLTTKLQGNDKLKYISIALNKSSINTNKRELIMSIITNNAASQGSFVDETDPKLGEASVANQQQKVIDGQDINLAAFIQNEGGTSVFNSISENMTELLKNQRVYIFKCKFEK